MPGSFSNRAGPAIALRKNDGGGLCQTVGRASYESESSRDLNIIRARGLQTYETPEAPGAAQSQQTLMPDASAQQVVPQRNLKHY
jgi:hypothetical protein